MPFLTPPPSFQVLFPSCFLGVVISQPISAPDREGVPVESQILASELFSRGPQEAHLPMLAQSLPPLNSCGLESKKVMEDGWELGGNGFLTRKC